MPDNKRYGVFWMGRKALAAILNYEGAFNDATLRLLRGASVDDVIAAVDNISAPMAQPAPTGAISRRRILFSKASSVSLCRWPASFRRSSSWSRRSCSTPSISRQIETQREEIGLLKAFGYSNAAVGWHFVKFALVVSVLGLALGWSAGAWFGYQITELYREYFRFPVLTFAIAPDIFLMSAGVARGRIMRRRADCDAPSGAADAGRRYGAAAARDLSREHIRAHRAARQTRRPRAT